MSDANAVVVGIDVAKATLDVAWYGQEQVSSFGNDEVGLGLLIKRLQVAAPKLIVMEASGGYESLAAGRLGAAGFAVAKTPAQARNSTITAHRSAAGYTGAGLAFVGGAAVDAQPDLRLLK